MAAFLLGLVIYIIVWFFVTIYFKHLQKVDYMDSYTPVALVAFIWPLTLTYVVVDRLADWITEKLTYKN